MCEEIELEVIAPRWRQMDPTIWFCDFRLDEDGSA
jgi:hypothetical protein